MKREDDLKRRLRALSDELERGAHRPNTLRARRPVKLRHSAAGAGLALSIAAVIAIVFSVIPRSSGKHDLPLGVSSITAVGTPTQSPSWCGVSSPRKPPPSGIHVSATITWKEQHGPPLHVGDHTRVRIDRGNETGAPIHEFHGEPRSWFQVYSDDGTVVYDSAPGRPSIGVADSRPAGAVDSDTYDWNLAGTVPLSPSGISPCGGQQPLPPGHYTLVGFWDGSWGGASEPVSLVIQ
ncbi:MAG: hypothetical protein ACYDCC_15710 [Actinomycetota bacterium]